MSWLGWNVLSGGGTVDSPARSTASLALTTAEEIARPTGTSVPAGESTFNAGRLWSNRTAAAIVIPATDSAANMVTAGFTEAPTVVVDEVVLSTTDLTGVAPAGAKIGRNLTNGREFDVSGGSWRAIARSAAPSVVDKVTGETADVERTNVVANGVTLTVPAVIADSWYAIAELNAAGTQIERSTTWIERGGAWLVVPGSNVASVEAVRTVTADATATITDDLIFVDAAAAQVTITLPTVAAMVAGTRRTIRVKKIDTSTNAVRVVPSGTDTVETLQSNPIAYGTVAAWTSPQAHALTAQATSRWSITT